MPDGSVRIQVDLDSKQAEIDLKDLKSQLARAGKDVSSYEAKLAKAQEKLSAYNQKKVSISDMTEARLQYSRSDAETVSILAQEDEMLRKLSAEYAGATQEVNAMEQALAAAKADQAVLTSRAAEQATKVADLRQAEWEAATAKKAEAAAAKEAAAAQREHDAAVKQTKRSADNLTSSLQRVGRKITRIGIAMLGARGIFGVLRKSVSAYLSDNQSVANQIASIWSALGNALGPIINRIVSGIMYLVSVINTFVKMLTGKDLVAAYNAKQISSAASATDELAGATGDLAEAEEKRQQAGFDEMNTLQDTSNDSSSGGGGSSGGSGDIGTLEVPEVSDKVKAGLQWVADNIKEILVSVGAVAAGLLAWKIADAFQVGLKGCFGIFLAIAGAVLLVYNYIDAWINGIDLLNMLGMFAGLACLILGIAIAIGPVAATITALIGGIALVVLALKEWITTGELSAEACAVLTTGILLIGGAISVLTGSFIPLIIAAIVALVVLVITYWDEIVSWCKTSWEKIKDIWGAVKGWFNEKVITPVKTFFTNLWSGISTKATEAWTKIKSTFATVKTWFSDTFGEAWQAIKDKFSEWGSFWSGLWTTIKDKFSSLGTSIGSAISNAVKSGINGIISKIQSTINSAIGIINGAIGLINLIPGVSVGTLSYVYLPRLAKGGVVNNPGRGVPAIIGEAGREAVLPLERNTEWMDTLADKIASRIGGGDGQIVLNNYLSGRKIASEVIAYQRRLSFATNNA